MISAAAEIATLGLQDLSRLSSSELMAAREEAAWDKNKNMESDISFLSMDVWPNVQI